MSTLVFVGCGQSGRVFGKFIENQDFGGELIDHSVVGKFTHASKILLIWWKVYACCEHEGTGGGGNLTMRLYSTYKSNGNCQ